MAQRLSSEERARVEAMTAAGVFAMTVSNVLNDRPGASVATRRRVRAAAEKLGYLPKPAFHSLA